MEAASRVLNHISQADDRELKAEVVLELMDRVDDWKGLQVERFGELLLHGHFLVTVNQRDVTKEVSALLTFRFNLIKMLLQQLLC